MRIVSVNYTLRAPSRDYRLISEGIKSISGSYAYISDSLWLVKTSASVIEVKNYLKQFCKGNDLLFVAEVTDWASSNVDPDAVIWADGYFIDAA